jgi:hypothetical protein
VRGAAATIRGFRPIIGMGTEHTNDIAANNAAVIEAVRAIRSDLPRPVHRSASTTVPIPRIRADAIFLVVLLGLKGSSGFSLAQPVLRLSGHTDEPLKSVRPLRDGSDSGGRKAGAKRVRTEPTSVPLTRPWRAGRYDPVGYGECEARGAGLISQEQAARPQGTSRGELVPYDLSIGEEFMMEGIVDAAPEAGDGYDGKEVRR